MANGVNNALWRKENMKAAIGVANQCGNLSGWLISRKRLRKYCG